jgi:hypothetical protein
LSRDLARNKGKLQPIGENYQNLPYQFGRTKDNWNKLLDPSSLFFEFNDHVGINKSGYL